MRTVVIIQARMTSTRLPGKVLLHLGNKTVLEHVLERCRKIADADDVVCAVPDADESEPLIQICETMGVPVFRGSETDVLARYHDAAIEYRADRVMRVTSDCPLIDPDVCNGVLRLQEAESADYACNNRPRSFPHGLDCEAFSMSALQCAHSKATGKEEREHVTPWIRENSDFRRVNLPADSAEYSGERWTLDRPEDFTFFDAVFKKLKQNTCDWREIAVLTTTDPELIDVQKACRV